MPRKEVPYYQRETSGTVDLYASRFCGEVRPLERWTPMRLYKEIRSLIQQEVENCRTTYGEIIESAGVQLMVGSETLLAGSYSSSGFGVNLEELKNLLKQEVIRVRLVNIVHHEQSK